MLRTVCLLNLILCLSSGCQFFRQRHAGPASAAIPCPPAGSHEPCPVEGEAPVEVRKRAPAPHVIVEVPDTTVVRAPQQQQHAAPQLAPGPAYAAPQGGMMMAAGPQMMTGPQMASGPQMIAAGPQMMATGYPQSAGQTTSVQTVSTPRTRLGITLDSFKISLPRLRFVPVTSPSEVTTTTQFAAPPQLQYMQQPQYAMPAQYVQPPQYVMPPQYVQQPPAQVQYLQQPPAQVQYVQQPQPPAQVQYVQQSQSAPQVQYVQQPQGATQGVAPVCPPVTKETLDRLQAELDKTRAVMNAAQNAPGPKK